MATHDHSELDSWYTENLVCPVDHLPLTWVDGKLISPAGRSYPVVDGIPVMLRDDVEQTIDVAAASIKRARGDTAGDARAPELYLESLGISESEKSGVIELYRRGSGAVDPVVSYMVGATSGFSYKHLIGNLTSYPIPELRLPQSDGGVLLDLGCNWGRWCIAAARKGYAVVGLDPSLGAIMAARRVARQMGLPIRYLVADSRYLPLAPSSCDVVFSYSVLQHLSKADVDTVLADVSRVLRAQGKSFIQMPNFLGIRCLQHQARRRFRRAREFEVRYWSVPELRKTFERAIGRSTISVDCYFGIGLQKADIDLMPRHLQAIVGFSEVLRAASNRVGALKYLADSVYVESTRR